MPGPTDTPIFTRPENLLADNPIAKCDNEDDVTMVARAGYDGMMTSDKVAVPKSRTSLSRCLQALYHKAFWLKCSVARPSQNSLAARKLYNPEANRRSSDFSYLR